MARKSIPQILINAARISIMPLTIGVLMALWTTEALADLPAFQKCTSDKVTELLQLITILTIVSLFFEHILGEIVFGAASPRFKMVAVTIGKKFVPWIGAAMIAIELIDLLRGCIPQL